MSFGNLTEGQQKILRVLAARRLPAPYGDPDALALIHAEFARRTTAFGTIEITAAGKAALANAPLKASPLMTAEEGPGGQQ